MARKRNTISDYLNELTSSKLYQKYKLLALDAFVWEGLPDYLNPKHIEHALFEFGKAAFFKKADGGLMCLPATDGGKYNAYHEPLDYRVTGHGFTKHMSAQKCVIVENNELRLPTKDFVLFYVNKLTEAERTMDVNVKACKTPYIIACDDKDVLTFKRIFQQVDGNTPAVYADKGLNLDALKCLSTGVSFMCNEIFDYKRSVEGELLTLLGYNNVAIDKKERVNTKETDANNQLIQSYSDIQLKTRQRACELINEKYNLTVSVRRRVESVEVKSNVEDHTV